MKSNKNLIYSVLLFLLANTVLFIDPFKEMRYMIVFVAIFLICSVYTSVRFIVKDQGDKKLLKIIPKSLLGFLAVILVAVSLIYIKIIVVGFMAYL